MTILGCTRKLHRYYREVLKASSQEEQDLYTCGYNVTLWTLSDKIGPKATARIASHITSTVWEQTFCK